MTLQLENPKSHYFDLWSGVTLISTDEQKVYGSYSPFLEFLLM